jgi:hypothetical protein
MSPTPREIVDFAQLVAERQQVPLHVRLAVLAGEPPEPPEPPEHEALLAPVVLTIAGQSQKVAS